MEALVQDDYITGIDLQSFSPSVNTSQLDSSVTFNPLASPSYNGSYNSPFSGQSELSYGGDDSFPSLFEDRVPSIREYDPADYDPPHISLLMFNDTDFINSSYDAGFSAMNTEHHSNQAYDYSSPSSNASAEDRNRSRASSVSSNPHSHPPLYESSPRLGVALENMKFSPSPSWGTKPLPHDGKTHSPPRLLMPQDAPPTINAPDGDGPNDGSVAGPSLNIVPATPISGGGLTSDSSVPFQARLDDLSAHSQPHWAGRTASDTTGAQQASSSAIEQQVSTQQQQHQQQLSYPFLHAPQNLMPSNDVRSMPGTPSTRPMMLEDVPATSNTGAGGGASGATHTSYLFPQGISKVRSKSEAALEPPNWDTSTTNAAALLNQSANSSAVVDDNGASGAGINFQDVQAQTQTQGHQYSTSSTAGHTTIHGYNFPNGSTTTAAPANTNSAVINNYLSAGLGPMRRAKSDSSRPGLHHRLSQSEDMRSLTPIGSAPAGAGYDASSLFYPSSANTTMPNSAPAPSTTVSGFLAPGPLTHMSRFLSPREDVPSIRSSHRHTRSLTGHLTPNYAPSPGPGPIRRSPSSTRSEASGYSGGSTGALALGGSARVSPYPSPKASPRPPYLELPPSQGGYEDMGGSGVGRVSGWMGGMSFPVAQQHPQQQQVQVHANDGSLYGAMDPQGMLPPGMVQAHQGRSPLAHLMSGSGGMISPPNRVKVKKNNVTTDRTKRASVKRRKADATFTCPVPGCGSTFTRSFNLRGHLRSHNEEKPFTCGWPGCSKAFARQHDCKRHEALHTNYRPFICEGCTKPFARMDALNRHLRSEGGSECAKVQKPSSLSGSPTGGGQLMIDRRSGQMDENMEVDLGDMFLGDAGDSSPELSSMEELKPGLVSTKLEEEWPGVAL